MHDNSGGKAGRLLVGVIARGVVREALLAALRRGEGVEMKARITLWARPLSCCQALFAA